MREGLYAIDMPVTDLIECTTDGYLVGDMSVRVEDWPGLRRDVREGQEIILAGCVPEEDAVIQVHAVVVDFDDDAQVMKVVV